MNNDDQSHDHRENDFSFQASRLGFHCVVEHQRYSNPMEPGDKENP
jgi:hypothetical protein